MRSEPLWKSPEHAERDRVNLRKIEKDLDRTLRFDPPVGGRIWRENSVGLKMQCYSCGRIARTWLGTYFMFDVAAYKPPFSIHRSPPLCAYHAIAVQRVEMMLPHWRPRAQMPLVIT
jgi:hypothetical protein